MIFYLEKTIKSVNVDTLFYKIPIENRLRTVVCIHHRFWGIPKVQKIDENCRVNHTIFEIWDPQNDHSWAEILKLGVLTKVDAYVKKHIFGNFSLKKHA